MSLRPGDRVTHKLADRIEGTVTAVDHGTTSTPSSAAS